MARSKRKSSGSSIRVDGIAELQRDLKDFAPELKKETSKVNRRIAAKEFPRIKSAAEGLGSTAAKSAESLKPRFGEGWAGIELGYGTFVNKKDKEVKFKEIALGAEFGGQGRPTTMQFQPHRGSDENAGYFVFPTIRRDADEIEADYMDGIDAVLKKTGWRL